jgi:phosphohistidine phosphatase
MGAGRRRERTVGEERARTLLVLRHAKAEHTEGVADVDRGLTARGRRDAAAVGGWLRESGLLPGRVLCSSSARTRQTWQEVSAALGPQADTAAVSFESRLYYAGVGRLLDAVREVDARMRTVLLVGHNPAVHELVADLTGTAGFSFPTCALAVISVGGGWPGLAPGGGGLASLWTPRGAA